jgi:hypothetical protein
MSPEPLDPSSSGSDRYPQLRGDIEIADRILGPALRDADARAVSDQGKFRVAELAILYGGVIAVGLAVAATQVRTFGLVEALLAAALGALAFISRNLKWQPRWLKNRWLAETLRAERFLFIGRLGEYGEAAEPDRVLRRRLVDIERMAREAKTDA